MPHPKTDWKPQFVQALTRFALSAWACLLVVGTFSVVTEVGHAESTLNLSLSLRVDAHYDAQELLEGAPGVSLSPHPSVNERWGFALNHAHLFVNGSVEGTVSYFLDLNFLSSQTSPVLQEGALLPFVSEFWVERQVSRYSLKAGRMWVRSGAFENDRSVGDVYAYSRSAQALAVNYLTGVEFGVILGTSNFFAQILNSPHTKLSSDQKDVALSGSWYGEWWNAQVVPMLTVLALPAEVADGENEVAAVTPQTRRRGWLFHGAGGVQLTWDALRLSAELGQIESEAGLQQKLGLTGSGGVADASPFFAFLDRDTAVKMRSAQMRMDFDLHVLRPYAKASFDHVEVSEVFFAQSWGVSLGLESVPIDGQYRTHLVFWGRQDHLENAQAQSRGVLLGTRLSF